MSDLAFKLRIEANSQQATGQVIAVEIALKNLRGAANSTRPALEGAAAAADKAAKDLKKTADGAKSLEGGLNGAQGAIRGIAAAIGLMGVRELVKSMTEAAFAAKGFETGLGAVTSGTATAATEMGFVREQAARMGLDLQSAASSFLSLAGATNGTALAGAQTRQIWQGVMETGLAMGRSNEQISRGLEAISQVASKGVVSMEEIRQQLAEAIPGATNIAARAMGMSTQAFNALVASGNLAATDFLPKFAAELRTEFGPAVDKYLNSDLGRARVALGELKTSLFDLSSVGGEAFLGGVIDGLEHLNGSLTEADTQQAIRNLARELGELVGTAAAGLGFLAENADKVVVILGILAGIQAGASIATFGLKAAEAAAKAGILISAMGGLSVAAPAAAEGVTVLGAAIAALGGPITIAAAIAGGVMVGALAIMGASAADAANDLSALHKASSALDATLDQGAGSSERSAGSVAAFGGTAHAAQTPVVDLTGKVGGLTRAMYELAAANKAAAISALQKDITDTQLAMDKVAGRRERQRNDYSLRQSNRGFTPNVTASDFSNPAEEAELVKARQAIARSQARLKVVQDTPLTKFVDPRASSAGGAVSTGSGSKGPKSNRAGKISEDLAADVIAMQAYRQALSLGGAALDDWRIKDAGRQAVEKAGLEIKGRSAAAEGALAAKIRASAEESERLKLANERVEKAIGIQRSAEQDTAALQRRSVAVMAGVQALEDLQVKEAGLNALRQIGVETLDQLSGADRKQAEAALAAAEAKERQAIATEKVTKVASSLQDLAHATDIERQRAVAISGGVIALADYAKAEFIRQEVERAGTNLTEDQVAQLQAKASALWDIKAANDAADMAAQLAEELRLMGLTSREREIEVRTREYLLQLHAKDINLSEEELRKRAKIMALNQMDAEARAKAISGLGDSIRDEFIKSGKLGFDDVASYAEEQFRKVIYDTFLAKPITVAINAVVQGLSGLTGKIGGLAGRQLGTLLGSAGIGQAAGHALGLGTGNSAADMLLSLGGAGLGTAFAGSAAGVAMGGSLMGVASSLGAGAMTSVGIGSLLSSAAVLGPIAAIAALAVGTLFKSKPSNNGALATLDDTSFNLSGNKRTSETAGMATNAANAILQGEQILRAAGITLAATVKTIDIGTRDATDIILSDGRALTSAVGDPSAAAEAALKAVLEGATYTSDAQKTLVTSMLAAGKGFDDIAAALGPLSQAQAAAQAIPQTLADAILKISDPKAFDIAALQKDQAARRGQVADLASYLSPEQLASINDQLTRLEGLELDEVMKRYAVAVQSATDTTKDSEATTKAANERAKAAQGLSANLEEGFLKILNPAAYQLASGRREIEDQIAAMKTQAEALIATGELTTDVLGRIDALKDLQLQDLIKQVSEAADTFASVRRSLNQWLDNLNGTPSSELSPVAARDQALADYNRVLAQAQGGDAQAASDLTQYADRLLSADRQATDSAQERLALYNKVRAEVAGVAASGGASAVSQLQPLLQPLEKLLATSKLTQSANDNILKAMTPALAVTQADLPALSDVYLKVQAPQTDRVVSAIDGLRVDLMSLLTAIQQAQATSAAAVSAVMDGVVSTISAGLSAVQIATEANGASLDEIRLDNRIKNALASGRFAA